MLTFGNLLIFGVDIGNRNIKTASTEPVIAGFEVDDNPLPVPKVLYYNDRYYAHTDKRLEKRADKTKDMDYYILTLMAVADEMMANGLNGGNYDIVLAPTLPPGSFRVKDARNNFERYFMQQKLVQFAFSGYNFSLNFVEAMAAPQAYAAVDDIINRLEEHPRVLIVDIGGGTVDFMELIYGKPTANIIKSQPWGTIKMYDKIIEYFDTIGEPVAESAVDEVFLNPAKVLMREERQNVIRRLAQEYILDLIKSIKARGYPITDDYVVFCGGGSLLFETVLRESGELNAYEFIGDIRACARGAEQMVKRALERRERGR